MLGVKLMGAAPMCGTNGISVNCFKEAKNQ